MPSVCAYERARRTAPPRMTQLIATSHGRIAIAVGPGQGLPVLLLHGNSGCKEVFAGLLAALGGACRPIAIDLPGHGASDDALDPLRSYSIPGYADLVQELAAALGLDRYAVFGWSLGGHVAIELLARGAPVGIATCGTPPIGRGRLGLLRGYRLHRILGYVGRRQLDAAECAWFASVIADGAPPPGLAAAVARTDGRARELMLQAFAAGRGADQRRTVESSPLPLAILDGAADPLIRHGYTAKLRYANLWRGRPQRIEGAGHAPFLGQPQVFQALLGAFLADLAAPAEAAD